MVKSKKNHNGLVFLLFFLALLILAFFIVKPYLIAVIVALILGYVFYPVYKKLNKLVKSKTWSSLIMSILLVLIFFVVVGLIANALISESVSFFRQVSSTAFDNLINSMGDLFGDSIDIEFYLKDLITTTAKFLVTLISNFIVSIPARLLGFFVMVFTLYYTFKDGSKLVSKVKEALPLENNHKEEIFDDLKKLLSAIIFGYFMIGILQGLLGGLGFVIFGFKNPVLWGAVMAVLALIPFIGTLFIWLPAGIFAILSQDYVSGIGLIIWGALVVGTIDNLLRPKIIGDRSKIHPTIILLGLLGGISLFGFIGIFIGPIILSITLSLLEELKKHYF